MLALEGLSEFERIVKKSVASTLQIELRVPEVQSLIKEIDEELKAEPQVTATDEKSPARADDYSTKGTKKPTRKKAKNH